MVRHDGDILMDLAANWRMPLRRACVKYLNAVRVGTTMSRLDDSKIHRQSFGK